jgi:membrane-bound lytic murein transglycosylase D
MLGRLLPLLLTTLLAACGLRGVSVAPETRVPRVPDDRSAAPLPRPTVRPLPAPVAYAQLPCIDGPEVDRWERHFEARRQQWRSLLVGPRRGGRHLPTVRRMIQDAGLPPGLALLPAIESGYRPDARGPRGSAGLWQLSAATARSHGLTVSETRDDRLDVERSTTVAISLLGNLHERYGTWPLALAAYNAGEGRVDRARSDQPEATFWDLSADRRLPPVTRRYVPKFLGLVRFATGDWLCAPEGPPSGLATR